MLQHETWPIDKLIEYARNPRKNDHAVDRVAAAIREFGFRVPVVAKSDGTVVDGHLRLKAAKKLGLTEAPVVLADDMTDLQIKAFRLSVNKMAELAQWDEDMLKIELEELSELGFDLELTGFTDEEILALGEDELADDDEPGEAAEPKGNLSDRFMIPPFTVLNAREGWWQSRKKAWLAIGIKSELGRGGADHAIGADHLGGPQLLPRREQAAPGGSARPACDYSKKQRGNGAGRPISG